ncbi:unnamed protein product [Durusdinium trenchii]|uniref:Bifunctional lysine-specific demethylase and histidyl-hydroxylase n=1 Tax=Durusdinium trenchii TaxID=1381693 RepID=A0ABP0IXH7_9DINO
MSKRPHDTVEETKKKAKLDEAKEVPAEQKHLQPVVRLRTGKEGDLTVQWRHTPAAPVREVNSEDDLKQLFAEETARAVKTTEAWVRQAEAEWIDQMVKELSPEKRHTLRQQWHRLQAKSPKDFFARWGYTSDFASLAIELWLEDKTLEEVLQRTREIGQLDDEGEKLPPGYLLQGSWIASSLARREDGLSFSQVLQMVRRLSGPEASVYTIREENCFEQEPFNEVPVSELKPTERQGSLNTTWDYAKRRQSGVELLDNYHEQLRQLLKSSKPVELNRLLYLIWKLPHYVTSYHQDTHVPPHFTLYNQVSGVSIFHFLPVLLGLFVTHVGRQDPLKLKKVLDQLDEMKIGSLIILGPGEVAFISPMGSHGVWVPGPLEQPEPSAVSSEMISVIRAAEVFVRPVMETLRKRLKREDWKNLMEVGQEELEKLEIYKEAWEWLAPAQLEQSIGDSGAANTRSDSSTAEFSSAKSMPQSQFVGSPTLVQQTAGSGGSGTVPLPVYTQRRVEWWDHKPPLPFELQIMSRSMHRVRMFDEKFLYQRRIVRARQERRKAKAAEWTEERKKLLEEKQKTKEERRQRALEVLGSWIDSHCGCGVTPGVPATGGVSGVSATRGPTGPTGPTPRPPNPSTKSPEAPAPASTSKPAAPEAAKKEDENSKVPSETPPRAPGRPARPSSAPARRSPSEVPEKATGRTAARPPRPPSGGGAPAWAGRVSSGHRSSPCGPRSSSPAPGAAGRASSVGPKESKKAEEKERDQGRARSRSKWEDPSAEPDAEPDTTEASASPRPKDRSEHTLRNKRSASFSLGRPHGSPASIAALAQQKANERAAGRPWWERLYEVDSNSGNPPKAGQKIEAHSYSVQSLHTARSVDSSTPLTRPPSAPSGTPRANKPPVPKTAPVAGAVAGGRPASGEQKQRRPTIPAEEAAPVAPPAVFATTTAAHGGDIGRPEAKTASAVVPPTEPKSEKERMPWHLASPRFFGADSDEEGGPSLSSTTRIQSARALTRLMELQRTAAAGLGKTKEASFASICMLPHVEAS